MMGHFVSCFSNLCSKTAPQETVLGGSDANSDFQPECHSCDPPERFPVQWCRRDLDGRREPHREIRGVRVAGLPGRPSRTSRFVLEASVCQCWQDTCRPRERETHAFFAADGPNVSIAVAIMGFTPANPARRGDDAPVISPCKPAEHGSRGHRLTPVRAVPNSLTRRRFVARSFRPGWLPLPQPSSPQVP